MKNILKYTLAAAASLALLSACEEMEDFTTTIDAADKLVYVNPQEGSEFTARIMHRPIGSEGEFSISFPLKANTTSHEAFTAGIELDATLVETYNAENGTEYVALPAEYIKFDKSQVTFEADANTSVDSVAFHLDSDKDLSQLTERYYLAPFKVVSNGLTASKQLGNLWLLIETETNLIRPITGSSEMVGFSAGGRSLWTADTQGYEHLFDGNTDTELSLSGTHTFTIDMKQEQMVTGLRLYTYPLNYITIEYSVDGQTWSQAGTPRSGDYAYDGSSWSPGYYYVAVYDYFTARYLRLTTSMSGYAYLGELDVYVIESTEPTIYTETGSDNVVSGKVVHKKSTGQSSSDFYAEFPVMATISSDSGYSVTAAIDESYVATYNQAHGTSYDVLPAEYLNIENANLTIPAGGNSAEDYVRLSLTGDISQLNSTNGYLTAIELSANGAVTSPSKGVVYVQINSESNILREISSSDDMVGFLAGGKSGWTANVDNYGILFDGDYGSYLEFNGEQTVTIDLAQTMMITGLKLRTYSMNSFGFEYSEDGRNWQSAGSPGEGEYLYTGLTWSEGDYYVAVADYITARYLRLTFEVYGYWGYYNYLYEVDVYMLESSEPTIYTVCGTDNTFTGKITHHAIAGTSASLSAEFNVMTTISSESGYEVGAEVNSSLVNAYNREHGTSYAALDAGYVQISGVPCSIAPSSNTSDGTISVSLTGDLSGLTNANGYLVPIQLTAPSGAVVSSSRGTVYVIIEVDNSTSLLRSDFDPSILTNVVTDKSGWTLLACDEGGIHSSTDDNGYNNLFDGNTESYVRTWGGPVSFTVDLGREYEITGFSITARTDVSSYSSYQPNSITFQYSTDNNSYEMVDAMTDDGTLVQTTPTSYVAFYSAITARYLKFEGSYGSNMGAGEFDIYVK